MATTKKATKTLKKTTRKRPAAKKSPAKKASKATKKRSAPKRNSRISIAKLDSLTDLINKIEVEAEKIAKRVIDRAEEATSELRNSVEDLLEKVRANGIYTVAADKKEDLEREIRRLAEDVVDRAKDVELIPFNAANRDRIISEAKRNLEDLRDRINATEWIARARVSASNTKEQVLSILSIPSHGELVKLQKKISNLEKRLNTINKKAA